MAPGGWRPESKRGDRWGQRGWEAGGGLRWRGRGRGRGDGGVAGGMVRGHLHQTDRLVEGIYNRGALVSVLGQYDFPKTCSELWIRTCVLHLWNLGGTKAKDLPCATSGLTRGREEGRATGEETSGSEPFPALGVSRPPVSGATILES